MEKKVAVFSDIHGNNTAFHAIYEDSIQQGVNEYWFLGDLFLPGPGSDDLWQLFKQINPAICIRGNWDDLLVKAVRGELKPIRSSLVYMAKLGQFIGRNLNTDIVKQIAAWPLAEETKIGKLRFGLSHNLPEINHGQELYPTAEQSGFDKLFTNRKIDVALYAHVHHPIMRYGIEEQLVLNPGSVGQPFNDWGPLKDDLRAQYLILNIDDQGLCGIEFRKVSYDRSHEFQLAQQRKIPYLSLYHDQMVNGIVHTHDHALLEKINDQYGYKDDVIAYNADHNEGKK